jgi:hypothetical protein
MTRTHKRSSEPSPPWDRAFRGIRPWATSSETFRDEPSAVLKANDANWVVKLAVQQIRNESFEFGIFDSDFAPNAT